MNIETTYNISFKKPVSPKVFRAIQNVDIDELSKCTEQEIRPILPCLVRMSLIAPLDTSKKCSKQKIDILTIISGIELVNSIVALLSIDFHALESDVKKEQQLRQKCGTSQNESVLISGLPNGLALEYERSDMTRRLRLVLSELLFIQSQIQESLENTSEHEFYMKQSELFDNDIYIEEISDVICIALAELPTLLNVQNIIETLLHVHNGPAIICRVVANFPDSFREVCTSLIQKGEKQEESTHSAIRLNAISMLCKMNPSEALSVRSKCVELCRMPALAICLSLDHASRCSYSQPEGDMVAFVSGLLLGNDQTVRSWFALFVRTGQKRKGEVSSNILQQLRDDLLRRLQTIIQASLEGQLPDSYVVQASALLRLYCALRGIAGIKFQDEEVNQIVQLLTSHPSPTPAGVRFVSLGLCMLIACPSLASQTEHERRSIEWVQWLVREEAYFESASGVSASFGEMLLLMAIHFHSNQLSAICDLVCATLGMKIPIRHNNMTRMKQVFTQEIFTEQVVTAHAVKVPVTNNLNATMTGFLPIHCIHQLLKSRAFAKHNVNIKNWIYKQICASTSPLHPVLPMLVDVYVNSIVLPSLKNAEHTNKPLSENEIRRVFKSSIFGQYFNQKTSSFILDFDVTSSDYQDIPVNESSLTPQLLLLYYLLLYEDCRLTNAQQLTASGRKIKRYSAEFLSELPIKYLLYHAQKDQASYSTLFGPLLKLLATHFPHLTLVDDWLDDMSFKVDEKSAYISELSLVESFEEVKSNPSGLAKVLQSLLKKEAIDIWPFAEVFTHYVKELLDENVPRHLQDLYKDVWLKLNTVLPRRLWVLTVKSSVGDLTGLVRVDVAEDPLQIMRCDERVFRCAPIYAIILRVLRASLASSRSQLFQHLQTNPKLDHMGQLLNDSSEREEMCRALVAAQDSAAVQVLLETCLETEQDRQVPGRLLALQEVRSLVCSYLHQLFIADTTLAKLVHFQGYPSELIEVTVKGVPSMHICLDFLLELMQQPSINKQIFAIQLLSHLSVQYALPKSLNLCVTALNLLYALLGGLSSPQRMKLFKPILPALVRISKAFPPLVDDITQLLLQLAKVCQSQASLTSHFSVHMNWDDELITEESKSLCELAQETFSEIVSQAVLKTDIYS